MSQTTPKEEAKRIYDVMKGFRVKNSHRKRCALLHVSEMKKELANWSSDDESDMIWQTERINFWNNVEQEINKL